MKVSKLFVSSCLLGLAFIASDAMADTSVSSSASASGGTSTTVTTYTSASGGGSAERHRQHWLYGDCDFEDINFGRQCQGNQLERRRY